jgi:hypothetical protein
VLFNPIVGWSGLDFHIFTQDITIICSYFASEQHGGLWLHLCEGAVRTTGDHRSSRRAGSLPQANIFIGGHQGARAVRSIVRHAWHLGGHRSTLVSCKRLYETHA